jgi:threonine synthase
MMHADDVILYCPSCGREYSTAAGHFACPEADGRGEHVLDKVLLRSPDPDTCRRRHDDGKDASFELFREFLGSRSLVGDERWMRIHDRVQTALESFEGKGFTFTPLTREHELAAALGVVGVLVKDETGNITGSHKGRHLMGAILYLEALRELSGGDKPELAVYSCGNAALAASAVARAGGYVLHAYVPEDVNPLVDGMLAERGAVVEKFARDPGQAGDPCYLAFTEALENEKYVPFSCSGSDNWSNIEGGETLGLEAALQLSRLGENPDHVVVQVGGGALGRSLVKAFQEAGDAGLMDRMPQIHACQPEGGFPFVRAYLLALADIARRAGLHFDLAYDRGAEPAGQLAAVRRFQEFRGEQVASVSEFARRRFHGPEVQATIARMASDRGEFMWPWDGGAPKSLAHGILDDETYDWHHLLSGMLETGGRAVVLGEESIAEAALKVEEHCAPPVCATGAAGVAGLMELKRLGAIAPEDEILVLFTGTKRE